MTGDDQAGDWVELFTDGACSGNPGPGGWGVLLRWHGEEKELSGGEADTTNNRMELMAAIHGLEALNRGVRARLYDWLNQVEGALVKPKDPLEHLLKLRFHQGVSGPAAYGFT